MYPSSALAPRSLLYAYPPARRTPDGRGGVSRIFSSPLQCAFAGPHPLGQRTTKGDASPVRSLSSPLFLS